MIRRVLLLILCVVLLVGCSAPTVGSSEEPVFTFIDDTGAEISAPCKPQRVAVLTSSLADLWITAGGSVAITVGETVERGFADDDVILVDEGAGKTIDLERLVASQPDLVLYSSDLSGQAECAPALLEAGIPAAGFSVETFDAYLELLRICTAILNTPEAYEIHGVQVKARVDELLVLANSQPVQPEILFVRAGSDARYTKAKTAENHFVCGMLQELGTRNIAEKAPVLLDGLSMEAVLLADPDAILFTTMGDESAGTAYMESLLSDPVWQTMTAVKSGQIHQLPKDLFQYKPNARWDEAYAYLIGLLYGEDV